MGNQLWVLALRSDRFLRPIWGTSFEFWLLDLINHEAVFELSNGNDGGVCNGSGGDHSACDGNQFRLDADLVHSLISSSIVGVW